jgi:serine/threonine protein kinase
LERMLVLKPGNVTVSHRMAFPFLFSHVLFLEQDVVRKVHISKPTRDLRARLMPPSSVKLSDEENKLVASFIELLDRCLTLDPNRRITPREALAHPFIRG